ncbi:uncharacterized protein LOC135071840 [Ostrinia nubilalis]|uniref:uncharacterized protein LOC114349790 n=1 Tax=Ostrinia furnacalis TaxID=93504 RepID=UPI00103A1B1A|nr:uncharacterized protein LOC114349790 [Ostrinia furnacalis]
MNTLIILLCSVVGSTLGYYVQREAPYNIGPNDPYPVEVSPYLQQEPSQRLFWGNGQGSNQVGGTGWWATLTNKFPFLGNMFGRLEVPTEYGVPNQQVSTQYGVPPQQLSTQYGVPNQIQTQYGVPSRFQPQFYQAVPFQQSGQFAPSGRDVALTDDAVIITPPQVPIVPQPAPAPIPSPEPNPGYQYNKPQYRLELPHK